MGKTPQTKNLAVGIKESDSVEEEVNSRTDTIPDAEESGVRLSSNSVEILISQFQDSYRDSSVEIIDLEIIKLKFRYSLYEVIKKDFLKPIYLLIKAGASFKKIEKLAIERNRAFQNYLRLLEKPLYKNLLSDMILFQLECLPETTDWTSLEGLNEAKSKILDFFDLPPSSAA